MTLVCVKNCTLKNLWSIIKKNIYNLNDQFLKCLSKFRVKTVCFKRTPISSIPTISCSILFFPQFCCKYRYQCLNLFDTNISNFQSHNPGTTQFYFFLDSYGILKPHHIVVLMAAPTSAMLPLTILSFIDSQDREISIQGILKHREKLLSFGWQGCGNSAAKFQDQKNALRVNLTMRGK